MGAFFFALIRLLCVAGGKAYDNAVQKHCDTSNELKWSQIGAMNEKMAAAAEAANMSKEQFDKKTPDELYNELKDDYFYITGMHCDIEFFRDILIDKYQRPKEVMFRVWVSKGGALRAYNPFHHSHWPSYYDTLTDKYMKSCCYSKKDIAFNTIKRIEYNMRRYYPEFRFMFEMTVGSNKKRNVKDPWNTEFHPNYHYTPSTIRYTFRPWNDSETDPNN